MTGQHAGPRKDGILRYRVWPRPSRQVPEVSPPFLPAAPFEGAADETQMLPPTRPSLVSRERVADGLAARRELTAQADVPTTVIPALAPAAASWQQPVTAQESALLMARVVYPPADGTRERYAAVMCQVSAATGTRSRWEQPAMWRAARPGDREEAVMIWSPQRDPRLALEAGSGAVA